MVGSFYDPELDEGCAFEELISLPRRARRPADAPVHLPPAAISISDRAHHRGGGSSQSADGLASGSQRHGIRGSFRTQRRVASRRGTSAREDRARPPAAGLNPVGDAGAPGRATLQVWRFGTSAARAAGGRLLLSGVDSGLLQQLVCRVPSIPTASASSAPARSSASRRGGVRRGSTLARRHDAVVAGGAVASSGKVCTVATCPARG